MASTIHFSSAAPSAVPAQQFRLRTRSFVHSRHKLSWRSTTKRISAVASDADEIALLEKMLKLARERKEKEATPTALPSGEYDGKGFTIKTFNAISPVGLDKYPRGKYIVSGDDTALPDPPMGIMLRSHKLQLDDVCLLYTSPSPRDGLLSRMPSSA